jgi:DNA-binding ferritin-like protein (Dps family)
LIPETEACAGWNAQGIEKLRERTLAEWASYNHQVNQLPEEIRSRYLRIQQQAFDRHATRAGTSN